MRLNNLEIEKKAFKIKEVSDETEVEIYTLRYWEKNGLISPIRLPNGQRRYTDDHIAHIKRLKQLMNEEKLTIAGVKKRLRSNRQKGLANSNFEKDKIDNKQITSFLKDIKKDIKNILRLVR